MQRRPSPHPLRRLGALWTVWLAAIVLSAGCHLFDQPNASSEVEQPGDDEGAAGEGGDGGQGDEGGQGGENGQAGEGGASGQGGDQGSTGSGGHAGNAGSAGSAGQAGTGGQGGGPPDGGATIALDAGGGMGGAPGDAAAGSAGSGGKTDGSVGSGGMGGAGGSGGSRPDAGTDALDPGTGGTGGTPPPPWAACPAMGDCRILPLGDGLAEGVGSSDAGGYRSRLYKLAIADKKHLTMVGSLLAGPNDAPRNHEGHRNDFTVPNGARTGLSTRLPGIVTAAKPHIVLLDIGSEDIDANYDLPNLSKRVGALVDAIAGAAPDALIVLSTIPPAPPSNNTFNTRATAANTTLLVLARTKREAGLHVSVAAVDGAFKNFGSVRDGLHAGNRFYPNDAGYAGMADIFYRVVLGVLK